jgi:hypothetical protein
MKLFEMKGERKLSLLIEYHYLMLLFYENLFSIINLKWYVQRTLNDNLDELEMNSR